MKATCMLLQLFLACGWALVLNEAYGTRGFDPLENLMRAKWFKKEGGAAIDTSAWGSFGFEESKGYDPVYVGQQDGLMAADKIDGLPGQPAGVKFDQYAGYVTVDPGHGRALFYYFAEAPVEPSTKPLVLWLNGGPGCSSFGNGAMMELGPFRVKSDGKTLYQNPHAWNNVANIIFLESPAGVGFSYSNTTSDYNLSGDKRTAEDSYVFLINWLERFPQYKTRDFYITGESYAGHYVPQLAQKILSNNKITNQTVINLRGIAIGNAWIDDETGYKGRSDFLWTHALTSDEIHEGISLNCNFSSMTSQSEACITYLTQAVRYTGSIYIYNIYFPLCTTSSSPPTDGGFDPCSENYIYSYLNLPQVQKALHANVTGGLPNAWNSCSVEINNIWKDSPTTVLPVIQELMKSNISVWIYSGDVDGQVPVTSSRYSISTFNASVKTPWYPWYTQEEVGGYAVEYQGLAFVTVRDAGHFVPSYQPARALTLFSSFINWKLPPRN